jgi:cytochrome c
MKNIIIVLALLTSVNSFASQELATAKGCLGCHAIDNKVVGPAYRDVAKKYSGDKTAEDKLVQKVLHGGSGVWGAVPMPGGMVTEAESKTLVKWILGMKK